MPMIAKKSKPAAQKGHEVTEEYSGLFENRIRKNLRGCEDTSRLTLTSSAAPAPIMHRLTIDNALSRTSTQRKIISAAVARTENAARLIEPRETSRILHQ